VSVTETASSGERGLLDLLVVGALRQSLGSLEFVVRDRGGAVLSSGFNDVQGADTDRRLLLDLPVGSEYTLSLASTASGRPATKCRATMGPFAVELNATAGYQAFLWQCDDAPTASADECYWLADWIGASRKRAAVGESIALGVQGSDMSGVAAHVTWINQAPRFGSFSDRHGVDTRFTCEAASDSIPIGVVITGDGCSRHLSLSVACSAD
jgi:hypothetical protein